MNQHNEPDSVARFLRENRREVADNGYEQLATLIRWIGGVAAVILFIILGGMEWLVASGEHIWHSFCAQQWGDPQLHAFLTLLAGLAIVGLSNLLLHDDC